MITEKNTIQRVRQSREYSHAVTMIVVFTILGLVLSGMGSLLWHEVIEEGAPESIAAGGDGSPNSFIALWESQLDARNQQSYESRRKGCIFLTVAPLVFAVCVAVFQAFQLHRFRKLPEGYRMYSVNITGITVERNWGVRHMSNMVFVGEVAFTAENGERIQRTVSFPAYCGTSVDVLARQTFPVAYNCATDVFLTFKETLI